MMEIIRSDIKINFTSKYPFAVTTSLVLVLVSLYFAIFKMNYGVDFRGGAEIQVKFNQMVKLDQLRSVLESKGFKGVMVQTIGEENENEVLLKVVASEEKLNEVTHNISDLLSKEFGEQGADVRKVDIVGPKAGAELRMSGFLAMAWALLAIMVYIGLRFDFKYSPGAIVALFHDVSITLGIFALFKIDFTLQTVAALLAVIGYSVNDTVIVYDRVREHEQKFAGLKLFEHINSAINETLSRTLLTAGTTLFVSFSMLFFGGSAIADFFLAITIGIVVGTYSSIFIAAPVTILFDRLLGEKAKVAPSKV